MSRFEIFCGAAAGGTARRHLGGLAPCKVFAAHQSSSQSRVERPPTPVGTQFQGRSEPAKTTCGCHSAATGHNKSNENSVNRRENLHFCGSLVGAPVTLESKAFRFSCSVHQCRSSRDGVSSSKKNMNQAVIWNAICRIT